MLQAVSQDTPVASPINIERKKMYVFPEYVDWSGKKILIFENDYCSALLLTDLLNSTNARMVHIYKNTVMEDFYDESIDLIIKGIDISEMETGLELTKKTRLRYPHIPIIAHTACMFPKDIKACYAAGCNGFIGKPFEFDDFICLVMKYMM
jgi:CheY-like chemotaxis protein